MTMNTYTQWLNLDFDPFAPDATSRDFYCSGHRQNLLDQIVEFSLYSNAMIAVTGPLGAGKTTLSTNFCDRFVDEAVCIKVAATLFMN
jgi:type II secretory pathway predicted ATPase ExeA